LIPLALTASITASTFFSRARAFAFRVTDNFQGVFLNQRVIRGVTLSSRQAILPKEASKAHISSSEGAKHQTRSSARSQKRFREREKKARLPFTPNLLDMADVAIPNGHYMNGNADYEMADATQVGAVRFTSGLILPPPEIKCELFIYLFHLQLLTQPPNFKP
jgi:hypothetical protein